MKINSNNTYHPNFGLRLRLCDKSLLNLPHNKKLLQEKCPLDFFFYETKTRTQIDILLVDIKAFIRKYQNKEGNSALKEKFLRDCFAGVNKVKFFIKFCIPSPVIGGLLFSILVLILSRSKILFISLIVS